MNADRSSAYYSTYDAKSIDDALQREFSQGIKVITEESIPGSNLHSSCFIFPQNCSIRRIGFELCFIFKVLRNFQKVSENMVALILAIKVAASRSCSCTMIIARVFEPGFNLDIIQVLPSFMNYNEDVLLNCL